MAFETTWNGFVDASLDQQPSVGEMGRHGNIFYGIGYSGEGVNLSSVFGSGAQRTSPPDSVHDGAGFRISIAGCPTFRTNRSDGSDG